MPIPIQEGNHLCVMERVDTEHHVATAHEDQEKRGGLGHGQGARHDEDSEEGSVEEGEGAVAEGQALEHVPTQLAEPDDEVEEIEADGQKVLAEKEVNGRRIGVDGAQGHGDEVLYKDVEEGVYEKAMGPVGGRTGVFLGL